MRRLSALLLLVAGCGTRSGLRLVDDAASAAPDAYRDADSSSDASPDSCSEQTYPDAYPDAPLPGLFPLRSPRVCCAFDDYDCFGNAPCYGNFDTCPATGQNWCCAGSILFGRCMCGKALGCLPPEVCTADPGDVDFHCALPKTCAP